MWNNAELHYARVTALHKVPIITYLQTPEQAAEDALLRGMAGVVDLIGPEFTLPALRRALEALWGVELDVRNFHRQWSKSPMLEDTGKLLRGRGRPASIYRVKEGS